VDAAAKTVKDFPDHFSGIAAAYREFRPAYPAALIGWLAAQAPGRALAWEAGCGSGQFSVSLAVEFARVHATDASAKQIAQAGAHPRVEYAVAPAERSGLTDACADLVCAAQAAHWFDLPAFYAEARRVARPGAVIALLCYEKCAIAPDLDPIVDNFYSRVAGPFWPPERVAVEDGYRALPFPFPMIPAPPFHLEERWNLSQFLGYVATWSATQRLTAVRGLGPFDEFHRSLSAAWSEPESPRLIRWPLRIRAGRVR